MSIQSPVNKAISLTALLLLAGGAVFISRTASGVQGWLYLTGGALGLVLFHASFGFTASWREFVLEKRGRGIRAQMLMLAVASLIFLPVLDSGAFFGRPVIGAVAPLGWSVLVGAAVFGFGMQLGGACASGTLYTVGGGSARMLITLVFFMGGSLIGSAQLPWWLARPSLGAISLSDLFGLPGALALQLGLLAAIALYSIAAERRRHDQVLSMFGTHLSSMPLPERL
ncbi:MAG TPA: YeeE/YedE family protein, partial [Rhodobacteraceae bacterium]|nr:YeeE/YedE family protein [Paracoccaceae bacterium]